MVLSFEYFITRIQDSLRECNSISSTHTRRRLINVVPETREVRQFQSVFPSPSLLMDFSLLTVYQASN